MVRTVRPVIEYRSFLNDDVPGLKTFWRTLTDVPGLATGVRIASWDDTALAKPWFERDDLIVAVEESRIVGLVHVGRGPDPSGDELDAGSGVLSQVLVSPRSDRDGETVSRDDIAAELLRLAEARLTERGARRICALGVRPNCPFYVGMYGGSRAVGVYAADETRRRWLETAGYRVTEERLILMRSLRTFRSVVNRTQMEVRREHDVAVEDPAPADGWYAGTAEMPQQRRRFFLVQRKTGDSRGSLDAWGPPPTVQTWEGPCFGLTNLRIEESLLRKGLATYLVGETLARLQKEGVQEVEVQVDAVDARLRGLFRKLEFLETDRKVVYEKTLG